MSGFHDLNGTLRLPDLLEIEPTEACNLRCRMCHVSFMTPGPRPMLDVALLPKLRGLAGGYVIIAAGFEPTIHPDFNEIITALSDLDFHIEIVTNGTLLDKERICVLTSSNMYMFTFSFDGIRPETFEHIRRNAKFAPTIENILATRSAFAGRDTYFTINSTTMQCNLEETIEIIDFWDQHDFDLVRFLVMVVREMEPDLIKQSLYPIRDQVFEVFDEAALHVIEQRKRIGIRFAGLKTSRLQHQYPRNFVGDTVISDHPRGRRVPVPRHEHQLGHYPGMAFPCQSPFTSARILANGDVQLCYQFTIGNLHEASFEEIWYGERADEIRCQVMADTKTCDVCDYYRFCLSSAALDIERKENHFRDYLLKYADRINFETGKVENASALSPRLVESFRGYDVVYHDGRYIGVPNAAGRIDIATVDLSSMEGFIIADKIEDLRTRIRQEKWATYYAMG